MAQKATQAEVQYGKGDPLKHCGTCAFYRWHRCAHVMGPISPFGVCDLYRPDNNPFGSHLTGQEAAQIRSIFEQSEATSGA
jgi:hypothetical protein